MVVTELPPLIQADVPVAPSILWRSLECMETRLRILPAGQKVSPAAVSSPNTPRQIFSLPDVECANSVSFGHAKDLQHCWNCPRASS